MNRDLVRKLACWYLARHLEQPVTDPFSGYRCLSRTAFEDVRLAGMGYQGELELRFEAEIRGLIVSEVAVPRIYTPQFSKMGIHGGALVGRVRVVGQYLGVVARKRRELASISLTRERYGRRRPRRITAGRVRGARRH